MSIEKYGANGYYSDDDDDYVTNADVNDADENNNQHVTKNKLQHLPSIYAKLHSFR
jgi:hypothetical protein